MNKVRMSPEEKIFIDGVEIKNVSKFNRFVNMDGHGVNIEFYTSDFQLNSEHKMTKTEAENSIMRILKQYEADNNAVVDSVEITEKDMETISERKKIIRRLFIQEKSLSGSNWDI